MIGTIFAQDFRATRKTLATTVGILLIVTAVSLVLAALNVPVLGGFGLVLAIIASILITPIVLGLLAENYWRTMYGREGYFTMALPVGGRALFAAKVLYGATIAVAALAVTAVALVACAAALAISTDQGVVEFLRAGFDEIDAAMFWLIAGSILLQILYLVVVGAGLMSVGARARFNHLGFGAPVIGAVLMYVVVTVTGFAAMLFVPLGIRLTGPDTGTLVGEGMFRTFADEVTGRTGSDAPDVFGLGILLVSVTATCVFAWWGARSVARHTSLR